MSISQSYAFTAESSREQRVIYIDQQIAKASDLLASLRAERQIISDTLGATALAPVAHLNLVPEIAQSA